MAHETPEDLAELQRLLDSSHSSAGAHLQRIFSDERRVPAAELPERLKGAQVLALATVTARGEPRVAPVDGHLYRGKIWFGSAPDSMRFRHIRARPAVSGAITHGEEFALVVHGVAHEINYEEPEHEGFRDYLTEVYGGTSWARGNPFAWIEASKMFTFGGVQSND